MNNPRQLIIKKTETIPKAVVYVMSRDQRLKDNHALNAAQDLALIEDIPLYVLFILKNYSNRSKEHYHFMLQGLEEISLGLSKYNIPFILRAGDPTDEILSFTSQISASTIFFDFSPLRSARSLIKAVASKFNGSVNVIDTHNIIPVWVASDKQEFAAHTMRSKVNQNLEKYLINPKELKKQVVIAMPVKSLSFGEANDSISNISNSKIKINFRSGENYALQHLKKFIENDLEGYALNRNNMAIDRQSGLSPYLHFGQISSLRVALEVINAAKARPLLLDKVKLAEHGDQPSRYDGMNALLEEMIVRKELADNFCFYSSDYRTIKAAPQWAQKSLLDHATDERDFNYDLVSFESANTHDEIWNSAQKELLKTGKIHGYMRMYWAKKILEWSPSSEEALYVAIYLNDKYSIDGGDPNGYVGILWSIAGLHDRPWFERPVFGKIRYMNDSGLRRKFEIDEYIKRVNSI